MRVKELKLYRLELTTDEMRALHTMLQYYEDHADEDNNFTAAFRRDFGIKPSSKIARTEVEVDEEDDEPEAPKSRGESLPEKALRVSGASAVSRSRRKSRVTEE